MLKTFAFSLLLASTSFAHAPLTAPLPVTAMQHIAVLAGINSMHRDFPALTCEQLNIEALCFNTEELAVTYLMHKAEAESDYALQRYYEDLLTCFTEYPDSELCEDF